MEAILEAFGKRPTVPKSYDPRDTRSKAFFGQVLRNAMPTLSGTQRGKFLEYVGPLLGQQFRSRFVGASQKDLIQLARDLQQNESFQSTLKYYQTKMEQETSVPLTSVDAGTVQADAQPDNARANNKLRSRALLPTDLAYRETPMQAISDVALANEFDFRAPGEDLGQNNSLYLGNLQHDATLRFAGASLPRRPDDLERLVGTQDPVPQWTDDYPMEDAISDMYKNAVIQDGLRSLPPISVALKDNIPMPDPYGNYRPNNFFECVNNLQPGFERDFTQTVEFGELDARGFKPDYDPLRTPREVSRLLPAVPIQTKEQQLSQLYRQGFDATFSTGFVVEPQMTRGIDLKGFQWMDMN